MTIYSKDFDDFTMRTDTKVAKYVTVLRYGAGPNMPNAPLRKKKYELFWKVISEHCIQAMM